ncbi:Ribosomal large subunit pseudouridine synthase A [Gallibacterium anatis]|uniref:Ribosomal large subunit pseudouridine synthase A n=1 Tax=Gallibacterium anatis TaxID=750 RepID=A0A377H775_9PAST|nr:Ribosomal large subunit pseudouridine synthase A [Gallibacterium anatis]
MVIGEVVLMPFQIVAQTENFVVINKPCGVSVHKDDNEQGLTTQLAEQRGVEQVWLVHRLNKSTSGLLLCALNRQAAAELSAQFAAHQVQKTYLALATGKPKKKQGLIKGDMIRSRRAMWKLSPSCSNPAITRFYSISCESGLRLFVLKPQTGKTHQLRVAMKSLGSPILGDPLYGDKSPADRCYLHAAILAFSFAGERFCYSLLPQGVYFERECVKAQIAVVLQQEITEIQQ